MAHEGTGFSVFLSVDLSWRAMIQGVYDRRDLFEEQAQEFQTRSILRGTK